jgi:hypothetical protein
MNNAQAGNDDEAPVPCPCGPVLNANVIRSVSLRPQLADGRQSLQST